MPEIDGSELSFCIVAARYNAKLVDALLEQARATLLAAGVADSNILVVRVPGSNELPYVAHMHAASSQFDCILALGVVIAGETEHHNLIGQSTAQAFHQIGMQTEVPVINGVIIGSQAQVEARASGSINRGEEFAKAALDMAVSKIYLVEALNLIEEDLLDEEDGEDDDFENLFRKN